MRIYLAIAAGVACIAGVCFLVAGAALWLASRYGPLASHLVMGTVLVLIGAGIAVALVAARESAPSRSSIAERVFQNLGANELRGLGVMFESRPVLAAGLALMLGLEKGLRRTKRD